MGHRALFWFVASHPSAQNAEEWGTPQFCVI
jgi:hypothetical protein